MDRGVYQHCGSRKANVHFFPRGKVTTGTRVTKTRLQSQLECEFGSAARPGPSQKVDESRQFLKRTQLNALGPRTESRFGYAPLRV